MPNKAIESNRKVAPYIAELAHTEIAALLVEHTGSLRSFARSIASSRDQADDLVQEASLRALAAAAHFTPGTNFRAWIFTILRNLRYNEYRKPWLRHQPLHELLTPPSVKGCQDHSLEFCELRRAFAQLDADQRKALILVGIDGLSYEHAAQRMACAVGTVKSRVSRGRRILKDLLENQELRLPRSAVEPVAGVDLILAIVGPTEFAHHRRRARQSSQSRRLQFRPYPASRPGAGGLVSELRV